MQTLILSLHIIVCVILVILVLLQAGKEGMGVIFGGGNASVFGSGGAGGILSKLTAFMAVLFIFTSLSYTYVTSERSPAEKSVILDVKLEEMPVPPVPPVQAAPQGAVTAPAVEQPAAEQAVAQPATATDTATGAATGTTTDKAAASDKDAAKPTPAAPAPKKPASATKK